MPYDLTEHPHPLALVRELVLYLGRLYCAWPAMVAAATTLPRDAIA